MTMMIFMVSSFFFFAFLSVYDALPLVTFKPWATIDHLPTRLIGHRGEKVLFPEHSLPGYHVAAVLGADYVEPDLLLTRDGVPVCHHDRGLKETTNVAELSEFSTKQRDEDWFIEDFTVAELKKLRLRQKRVGIRTIGLDGIMEIPTFEEYLLKVKEVSEKLNRKIGIIPEIKEAAYFNQRRRLEHSDESNVHYFEDLVIEILRKHGYDTNNPKNNTPDVIIQSFEADTAKYVAEKAPGFKVCFLVDDGEPFYLTERGLEAAAKFAHIISPWKLSILNDANPENLVQKIHSKGLQLVVYTSYDSREDPNRKDELARLMQLGVDGIFVENVAEAKSVRDIFPYQI